MTGDVSLLDHLTANQLGPWRQGQPDTARQAALNNYPRTSTQRTRVLLALAHRDTIGATDYELACDTGIRRPHTAGTRRKELADRGLVEATDRTRPTDTGSPAVVWQITDLGRQAAETLGGDQ